jgi:LuxR family maltose regulon positive regulatory protein
LQDFAFDLGFHESSSLAFASINWGLIHYEWNDLAKAKSLIRAGERQATSTAAVDRLLQIAQALVKTSVTVEDVFDITKILQQIERLAQKYDNPPLVISQLNALHAFLALKQGESALPVQWAKGFVQKHKEIAVIQQFEWMTIARIWLAVGNEKDSIHPLQSLQTLAQEDRRNQDYIEISVLLVKAYAQSGAEKQALQLLQSVLLMAEPEGYIRTFVDAGELIEQLLDKLAVNPSTRQPAITYINKIRNAFPKAPAIPPQPLIENLTPRETEILHLLAEGLSYAQISEALTITKNTLKTHIKRIYSKLNVRNRVQAISAGRDAGILTG